MPNISNTRTTRQVGVVLPLDDFALIEAVAKKEQRTLSGQVRFMLNPLIEKLRNSENGENSENGKSSE